MGLFIAVRSEDVPHAVGPTQSRSSAGSAGWHCGWGGPQADDDVPSTTRKAVGYHNLTKQGGWHLCSRAEECARAVVIAEAELTELHLEKGDCLWQAEQFICSHAPPPLIMPRAQT